jgi:hypothetical protein
MPVDGFFITKKIAIHRKATPILCTFAPTKALLNSKSFVDYGALHGAAHHRKKRGGTPEKPYE